MTSAKHDEHLLVVLTKREVGQVLMRMSGINALLARYALLYRQHIPQMALDHRTPIDAMKGWQRTHPELFVKRIRKLTAVPTL